MLGHILLYCSVMTTCCLFGLSIGHGAVEGSLLRKLQVLQVQLLNQHSSRGHYDLHHHKRQKHTNVQGWLSQGDVANGDDAGDD